MNMARTARATKDEATKTPPVIDDQQERDGKPNGADIPSPDAAKEPSKFARFRVDDRVIHTIGEAASVEVKKPDNGVFFRTHPDLELYTPISCFERKAGGKKLYLIDPALSDLPEIEGMTKRVVFAPYVTQFGGLGVWPISIDYADMAWIKSALYICDEAKARWVAAISVKRQQAYRLQPSANDFGPPPWPPNLTQDRVLELAFRQDEWILDRDHEALKQIRGER
jgi:hypothetical protein